MTISDTDRSVRRRVGPCKLSGKFISGLVDTGRLVCKLILKITFVFQIRRLLLVKPNFVIDPEGDAIYFWSVSSQLVVRTGREKG